MILRAILFAALFLWFPSAYKRWTHSFRPAKCYLSWPYQPEWESGAPDDTVKELLKQPFSYFSKGAQSYVFLSEDGKYVLKLFKFDACRVDHGQKFVRKLRKWTGLREKHFAPFQAKAAKTFASCKLAYSLAPHLTGVVWVHLNPGEGQMPKLRLKDRLGRIHLIDPARYRFAIQRRAEPFLKTLKRAQDPMPLIESYFSLIDELSHLGLANLDPTMGRNFGFIEGRAVEIDFGNFALDPIRATGDPAQFSHRLVRWLEKNRPECMDSVHERAHR